MRYYIANADFPRSNYLSLQRDVEGNTSLPEKVGGKSWYGGLTIRIPEHLPQPESMIELQRLVNELINEAAEARKAKANAPAETPASLYGSLKDVEDERIIPEMDIYDPNAAEFPVYPQM